MNGEQTVYKTIEDADDHIGPTCPKGGYHAWYEPGDIESWKPGEPVLAKCSCGKQMFLFSEDGSVDVGYEPPKAEYEAWLEKSLKDAPPSKYTSDSFWVHVNAA